MRVMTVDVKLEHESRHDMGSRTAFIQANFIWKSKWRADQSWWRRVTWGVRAGSYHSNFESDASPGATENC